MQYGAARMGEATAVGFFLAPSGGSCAERVEDRTVVDGARRAEVAVVGSAGERAVFTAEMLETLRDRLRAAEAREGAQGEHAGGDGFEDGDGFDGFAGGDGFAGFAGGDAEDAAAGGCPIERLEQALGRVPELEVGLAPNSESNLYAGFDAEHPDGVFVATYAALPIGTPLYVTLHLPGGHSFRAPALVAWARDSDAAAPGAPAGLGLELCGLDREMRQLLTRFARHRAPLFYERP